MPQSTTALLHSRVQLGIEAVPVTVEVHLSNGLPRFHLVGLPEKGVRESKERVRSAILNAGFVFPDRHITVNLAPAHLPKPDSHLDLAIALGIVSASGQLPVDFSGYEFYGELALTGELRPIRYILAAGVGCRQAAACMIAPDQNAAVAAQLHGLDVRSAGSFLAVCAHLLGETALPRATFAAVKAQALPTGATDLSQVRGQAMAKRALVLAAAGGHHLVLRGAPGTGKTLLAQCLPGLLPPFDEQARTEAMLVHAMRDVFDLPSTRPFRQPHHSASYAAMVGGGQPLVPGEISLAHGGVLFLDEMHEFKPSVLNSMREPLEAGCIHLSRAGTEMRLPAKFMLVGACNPCPCGYLGQVRCQCSLTQVQRYQQRVSGPLWDRIDLVVDMAPTQMDWSEGTQRVPESAELQARVARCRAQQVARQGCVNALRGGYLLGAADLSDAARQRLQQAAQKLGLSMRASHRMVRVARSIADWEGADTIGAAHAEEALAYRLSE